MALMDGLQFNPRTHCFESPGEFARRFFHQLGDALGSIPTPPGAIVCCDEDALMEDFGNIDFPVGTRIRITMEAIIPRDAENKGASQ